MIRSLEQKKVLITGANGLIGSRLIDTILNTTRKTIIFAVARNENKLRESLGVNVNSERIVMIIGEISEKVNSLNGPFDFVFHAAGPHDPHTIKSMPLEVISANVSQLVRAIDLLKNQKAKYAYSGRLIVFSSLTVYGFCDHATSRVITEDQYEVNLDLTPSTAIYAESKRMSEAIANSYAKLSGIDFVICRLSTVYGPSIWPANTAFNQFVYLAKKGQDIVVKNQALPRRDNIYVEDAVEGLVTVSLRGESGEAYNISSNGDRENFSSVGEIAEVVAAVANTQLYKGVNKIDVQYLEWRESSRRIGGLRLDNSKLKNLGWSVKYSLNQGIEDTLNFTHTYPSE